MITCLYKMMLYKSKVRMSSIISVKSHSLVNPQAGIRDALFGLQRIARGLFNKTS